MTDTTGRILLCIIYYLALSQRVTSIGTIKLDTGQFKISNGPDCLQETARGSTD